MRLSPSTIASAFLVLLGSPVAQAITTPAVAVMPFKDLSGSKGSIGEAIRETVTTDLKDVPGLRIIERSNIDKILAEQNLQGSKADLDPVSTVKVGKLLGASLIVAGAYQKSASNVRLTARFVKVETGEIVGTAKVDGHSSDFLKLQDRVTAELLKSAGPMIDQKHVQLFAKRIRPKIKSLKVVELYGDAAVELDDNKKRDFLKLALNEDPQFHYASRDLDELEKRLKQYDAVNKQETDRELKALFDTVKTEKDSTKLVMAYTSIFTKLMMQRRYVKLMALCRQIAANPPPPTQYINLAELSHMYHVQALQVMRDWDGILREGEKFLAKYPSSNYFQSVRSTIDTAIDKKRDAAEGVPKAQKEIAEMEPQHKKDECMIAQKYQSNQVAREAKKHFELCLSAGGSPMLPGGLVYMLLATTSLEIGDFPATRRYLEKLKAADPQLYKSTAAIEMTMPADG